MIKYLKTAFVIIVPFCLVWGGYVKDYSITQFSFYKVQNFTRIQAKDFTLNGNPGAPELPAVYLNYIIPPNVKVESLIVTQSNTISISGSYFIYPAQPPVPIGESIPWVSPDSSIYNSDEIYPREFIRVVDEGIMDGARIVTVEVRPLQYRPKSGRIFLVSHISFEFRFNQTNIPLMQAQIRGKSEQPLYDAMLRDVVANDNEIPTYYQKPTLVEESLLISTTLRPYPVGPCVIITPAEFFSAFQTYADWLTDQGIPTLLISPQTIYHYLPGSDDAEKVRNYIKECYQYAGGTYFILGGDDYSTGQVYFTPVRYCIPWYSVTPPVYVEDSIPCDMYFSDLSGNWNYDNDDYWGEIVDDQADRFPEVFIGRITAYNTQEVSNWVTNALRYEKTPNLVFNNALWVYNRIVGYGQAPSIFPDHFVHTYMPDYHADAVLNQFNQSYAFANICCHGNVNKFCCWIDDYGYWWGWIHSWQSDQPNINHAGLNWSNNLNKPYIVYSISCWNAAFDRNVHPTPQNTVYASDTCLPDAFIDAYYYNAQGQQGPFAACAFLGNTREGLGGNSHNLQYEFYWRIFNPWWTGGPPEPSWTRIGVAEALSKCGDRIYWSNPSDRYVCYAHNLFGSPYFESWTNTPTGLRVTHPTQIIVGQQIQYTVTVKDAITSRCLQYAKVCLNKPGDIYQVGLTNANGQITFTINPQTTGTMKITVTRLHNADNNFTQYLPSQTTCLVVIEPKGGVQDSGSDELIPTILCITQMPGFAKGDLNITFGIPKQGNVSLAIYDITGALVKKTMSTDLTPGYYNKTVKTDGLANGTYFIILNHNKDMLSRKFIILN